MKRFFENRLSFLSRFKILTICGFLAVYGSAASSSNTPTITNFQAGDTISTDQEVRFDNGGQNVRQWYVRAGSSATGNNYYDSGSLPANASSHTITSLPANQTIHVSLNYRLQGERKFVRDNYQVRTEGRDDGGESNPANTPTITNFQAGDTINIDQEVRFNNGGQNVRQWYVRAGSSATGNNYYDSGSLPANASSHTITGLPANQTIHVSLNYRLDGESEFVRDNYQVQTEGGDDGQGGGDNGENDPRPGNPEIYSLGDPSKTCSNPSGCVERVVLEGVPSWAASDRMGRQRNGLSFAIGDLNGDNKFDFVIKQAGFHDPYHWHKNDNQVVIGAHDRSGALLWNKQLGRGIENGIWYNPVIVYDLDQDGKAEVYLKNANDELNQWPNKVHSRDEWIEKISGETGEVLISTRNKTRADRYPPRASSYNNASRNQLTVAYLDGPNNKPSLIATRGTYNRVDVWAYDHNLNIKWKWHDSAYDSTGTNGPVMAADIDGDGRDEILIGSAALDEYGQPLWKIGGDTDMNYVGDLRPDLPGLELFTANEINRNGSGMVNAATGQFIWSPSKKLESQGICADLYSEKMGFECYSRLNNESGSLVLFDAMGNTLGNKRGLIGSRPHALWWNGTRQMSAMGRDGVPQANCSWSFCKQTVDMQGDWKEEILFGANGSIYIHSSGAENIENFNRLMHDTLYRKYVANGSGMNAYYHRPTLSTPLDLVGE